MSLQEEKQTPGCTCTGKDHSKKVAICKPWREVSGETKLADTLILDLQPPKLWENPFLLIKPPILWHFVMVAPAKECTCLSKILLSIINPRLNVFIDIECHHIWVHLKEQHMETGPPPLFTDSVSQTIFVTLWSLNCLTWPGGWTHYLNTLWSKSRGSCSNSARRIDHFFKHWSSCILPEVAPNDEWAWASLLHRALGSCHQTKRSLFVFLAGFQKEEII